MYRILSLDGGGVFGVHTAILIERLEKEHPGFLEKIDLISGTSIGGIIALGLANGINPSDVVEMFRSHSSGIFSHSFYRKLLSIVGFSSRYDNSSLRGILEKVYGKNTLLSHLKKKVVIPSFKINGPRHWHPKIFHNFHNFDGANLKFESMSASSNHLSVVDVGLATSAAPVLFPSHESYIDGGVAQNDPSIAAICQTQDAELVITNRPKLNEISLLSIGREYSGHNIPKSSVDWGWVRWAKPILEILLSGDMSATEYHCHQLLGKNYYRLSSNLPPAVSGSMDNTAQIPKLIDYSKTVSMGTVGDWLKTNW